MLVGNNTNVNVNNNSMIIEEVNKSNNIVASSNISGQKRRIQPTLINN
jgi:hypothetical protein